MPRVLDPDLEVIIKTLSKENLRPSDIQKRCREAGHKVTLRTIYNVRHNVGERRQKLARNSPVTFIPRPRPVRTKKLIRQIDNLTSRRDPPSHSDISKKLNVSTSTVQRVIRQDLKKVTRRKAKVHALTERHIKQRKRTSRIMYEKYLAGQRSKFMVTLDEANFYLKNCNGQRAISTCVRVKRSLWNGSRKSAKASIRSSWWLGPCQVKGSCL